MTNDSHAEPTPATPASERSNGQAELGAPLDEAGFSAVTGTAELRDLRITAPDGTSVGLPAPHATFDMLQGPIVRMSLSTDIAGDAHIDYDVAQRQPPLGIPSDPSDPLRKYFIGAVTVKRPGKPDIKAPVPTDLADNIPIDLTKGVLVRASLAPPGKPIGPLLNFEISQSA